MKKFIYTIVMVFAAGAANAETSIHEKIAADEARDPYAEAESLEQKFEIENFEVIEEYIPPKAAEQMKPSRYFKLEKGNTVVK